ncbi:acid trehalase-like protein 1 [Elysia marginata]|uniref:Protein-glucosylgalactosylhydroxylysine glucosidase n=1 Tax=Elysia marginata TaxID=1093978 RepID=A0AAV4GGJ9_9GAST|nr:acid trehalase-like protein 1 [Elysia marginata]
MLGPHPAKSSQMVMLSTLPLLLLTLLVLYRFTQADSVYTQDQLQRPDLASSSRSITFSSTSSARQSFENMEKSFGSAWQPPKERIRNNVVFPLPPSVLPEESSILKTDSLPSNRDYLPEVGNGHLATVVGSDSLFMNGLYNGANLSSHRARIPSPSGYSIQTESLIPGGLTRSYSLDIGRAIFTESYEGGGVTITLRTYAHSTLSHLLVSELALTRDDVNKDVELNVKVNPGAASEDLDFHTDTQGLLRGLTREAEYPELAPRTEGLDSSVGNGFAPWPRGRGFETQPSTVRAPTGWGKISMTPGSKGETYLALAALGHNRDIVLAEYALALQAWESGQLLSLHTEGWSKYWNRGRIDIEGNDYLGHVFWDQDTWMFPTVAVLHPDLGRRLVETRTRTLDAARLLAKRTGYKGARFPWESAFTGLETCPAEPYGEREIHINGDVSLMFKQYWQLTHDKSFMAQGKGAELVWGVADFWASRVTHSTTNDSYRILGVMPPDEWHALVNDSAYTNNIAVINLDFANHLKTVMGQAENPQWREISAKMVRPYDVSRDYHPEFEGFNPRDRTKQADVVLLGFPLMVDMKPSTRQRDLHVYDRTTPQGPAPAMTWGMFLIGWLELGDEAKAETLLTRSIQNAQDPFLVWSENADGTGAVNFLTGMGGYLQSVVFGYGGCRLHDDRMTFEPRLMPSATRMRFVGVSYRGCSLDLEYDSEVLTLVLTSVDKGHQGLAVRFQDESKWENLIEGRKIEKKRQPFEIQSKGN